MAQGPERSPFVQVSKTAEKLVTGQVSPWDLGPPVIGPHSDLTPIEAGVIFAQRKHDIYALLGVYTGLLVSGVCDEKEKFPPTGLTVHAKAGGRIPLPTDSLINIYAKAGYNPFFYANFAERDQLLRARKEEHPDPSKRALFNGTRDMSAAWGDFYNRFLPKAPKRLSVGGVDIRNSWEFVDPAIDNAVNFMTGFASLVPQVVDIQDFDCEANGTSPAEILENSLYLPQAFASTGLYEFSERLLDVVNPEQIRYDEDGRHVSPLFPSNGVFFNPDIFRIGANGDGKYKLMLEPEYMPARNPDALKCPGLINILGESAIKRLMSWNVKIGREFYPRMKAVV